MGRSSERLLMVLVGLVMLSVVAMVGFQLVTERNRSAAVAKLRTPEAIQRFANARAAKAGQTPAPAAQGAPQLPEGPQPAADSNERIAAFAQAFDRGKAMEDTQKWQDYLDKNLSKPRKEWTAGDAARAKEVVDENRELVREIRRLAKQGGPAYELDFSKGFEIELPHLGKLRHLARLLLADALVQGQEGHYGEVVDDVVAGIKLGGVPADEPILISQLVRIAITAIAFDAAQQALPPDGLSPELARRVIDTAAQSYSRQPFADCFSGEAYFGMDTFNRLRTGDVGILQDGTTSEWNKLLWRAYGSALGRPWLNMDEQTYVDTLARMGEAARLPYYQALPIMNQVDKDLQGLSFTQPVSRTMLPALTRAVEAQARNETVLDLLRLGLSVEQYHVQNGNFPATLDEVTSILGGSVPVDPHSGQAYLYKPSDGGFLLYSVGPNQVDDGAWQDWRKGDIVWRAEKKEKK